MLYPLSSSAGRRTPALVLENVSYPRDGIPYAKVLLVSEVTAAKYGYKLGAPG